MIEEFDEFELVNVVDSENETSNMELTKDNLMAALDEFDFRSGRPLPHEYELFRKLIDEYFETKESLNYAIKMYEDLLSKYAILFNLLNNKPLKFNELEVGMWVWDNVSKRYMKIYDISYSEECFNVNGEWYLDDLYLEEFDFQENRFYRREVKEND